MTCIYVNFGMAKVKIFYLAVPNFHDIIWSDIPAVGFENVGAILIQGPMLQNIFTGQMLISIKIVIIVFN